MKTTLAKTIGTAALAILMTVIFAQIRVSAQDIFDNEQTKTQKPVETQRSENFFGDSDAVSLEGSWDVQVTIRNCQNNAPITTFPAMNTFMQGGTMQEFSAGASFLRGPGHGIWSGGSGRFSYDFRFFRFNPDGTYAGLTIARRYITNISVIGDSYSAIASIEIYNPSGIRVATACGTETATRFR